MMNNLRENNCSIFSSADHPDPRKRHKVAHIEDPLWRGKYPNPFHMVFSPDGSKLYLSILHPSPAYSGISVIDTSTDTLIGILPSSGGHHDCVIIPTKLEHMKHTRACTL